MKGIVFIDKMTNEMQSRIEVNLKVLGGKPVIRGTRIPVYLILNLLAHHYSFDRIMKAYPVLTEKDVEAAIHYSEQRLKREEIQLLARG